MIGRVRNRFQINCHRCR